MATSRPFFVHPDDPPAKERILVEALRLFTRKGLCETTIRDIAEATGYTNPALYKHFASKEELAHYLLVSCHQELVSVLQDGVEDSAGGYDGRLRRFVEVFCRKFDERPEVFVYVSDNVQGAWEHIEHQVGGRTFMGVLGPVLEQGVEEGVVDPDLPRQETAAAMVGVLQQLARLWYLGLLQGPAAARVEAVYRMLKGLARGG